MPGEGKAGSSLRLVSHCVAIIKSCGFFARFALCGNSFPSHSAVLSLQVSWTDSVLIIEGSKFALKSYIKYQLIDMTLDAPESEKNTKFEGKFGTLNQKYEV